jgi:hypothetical protein
MSDRNSALFWHPLLVEAGLRMPSTRFVSYDHAAFVEAMEDSEGEEPLLPFTEVTQAAEALGWPVFVKTDLTSAKHDGPDSYKLSSPQDVPEVLTATATDCEMKLWLTGPTAQAFMLREWLDLPAPFVAFRGHPIAEEWRVFASPDGVLCAHFYWPENALDGHVKSPMWREELSDLRRLRHGNEGKLETLAQHAAQALGGEWSVDFARDRGGMWWLIDVATAETSWHPAHEAVA